MCQNATTAKKIDNKFEVLHKKAVYKGFFAFL